ncbi:hypothetical protein QVD17_05279 [Tagetes erecta]|uniref:Uncharacterized protein n=1 Tax=Tagetes erecta TaxID=13708 RepID=A0AAD8LHX0_TARER|nr:hypothetical protein QVD17_05279 [Tagetes erecta]
MTCRHLDEQTLWRLCLLDTFTFACLIKSKSFVTDPQFCFQVLMVCASYCYVSLLGGLRVSSWSPNV